MDELDVDLFMTDWVGSGRRRPNKNVATSNSSLVLHLRYGRYVLSNLTSGTSCSTQTADK